MSFILYINNDIRTIFNDTDIKIIKRLSPLLNYPTSYTISFNNPAEIENIGAAGYQKGPIFYDEPVITSSPFTYVDSSNTEYPLSYIRDDNYGNLVVYTFIDNIFTKILCLLGNSDGLLYQSKWSTKTLFSIKIWSRYI